GHRHHAYEWQIAQQPTVAHRPSPQLGGHRRPLSTGIDCCLASAQGEVATLSAEQRWDELAIAEDPAHGASARGMPDEIAMHLVGGQRVIEHVGVGDGLQDCLYEWRVLSCFE